MAAENCKRRRLPIIVGLWLGLSFVLPFILVIAGRIMHKRMQASPDRFGERIGRASQIRPDGCLVWVHAASVGEVTSIAKLARQITDLDKIALLVTTTTSTGATTVAKMLPRAVHQFLPLDTPAAVRQFLDHWRPDAALFVEGDLWPRMILSLEAHKCPVVLLNARASRSRSLMPAVNAFLLTHMRLITVQNAELSREFCALGIDQTRICSPGNLKADIEIPDVDVKVHNQIETAAYGRGVWAAVSTHREEESGILDVQFSLAGNPLLILVPRHPKRATELATLLAQGNFVFTRYSRGEIPNFNTQVHLIGAMPESW